MIKHRMRMLRKLIYKYERWNAKELEWFLRENSIEKRIEIALRLGWITQNDAFEILG